MITPPNAPTSPYFSQTHTPFSQTLNRAWFVQQFNLRSKFPYDINLNQQLKQGYRRNPARPLTPAAVMIALVERQHSLAILLTKRAEHLASHPGQISFPGGKVDSTDTNAYSTAMREVEEEIGIRIYPKDILGTLNPLPTVSGYLVTPVIGFVAPNYQAKIARNEVETLFELPLNEVLLPNRVMKQTLWVRQHQQAVYGFYYQQHLIWGITAQILHALSQQLQIN